MNKRSGVFIAALAVVMVLAGLAYRADSEAVERVVERSDSTLVMRFSDALYRRSHIGMRSVVEESIKIIPKEVDAFCDAALEPGRSAEEQKKMFYVLERLATEYANVTGDRSLIAGVKKRIFESRLSPATREKAGDLYVIENAAQDGTQHSLSHDNLVIRSGETVRWVNNNTEAQQIWTVLSPDGRKELLSGDINPGGNWDHTFYTPGEYYYISFPNKVLYGKVMVVTE